MNVLLLGGAGYVGRVVAERLFDDHHRLHVVDLFAFSPAAEVAEIATVERRDTRRLEAADFTDVDVVFDLAALPHDPAGARDPALTEAVNVEARRRAAALAKRMGVRRYVLFSSCAVYGADVAVVDETAPLDPPTVDAAAAARAEAAVLGLAAPAFGVTVFRLATVFGPSPGMRFDLLVNTMALDVVRHGRLVVNGDGRRYRPLVHVADVAEAASRLLAAPVAAVDGEIFNIGHRNLRIREVAEAVARAVDRPVALTAGRGTVDHPDQRVASDKARTRFGFRARRDVETAAAEIVAALERGTLAFEPRSRRVAGYRAVFGGRPVASIGSS
jgi:nucleoside-diphosphate-sugar epimerase